MNKDSNFIKSRKFFGWLIVGILVLIGLINFFQNFTRYPSEKVSINTKKDEEIAMGRLSNNGIATESETNRFLSSEQLVVILKDSGISKKGKILLKGPDDTSSEFEVNLTNSQKTGPEKIFLPQLSKIGKYLLTFIEVTNEKHEINFSIVENQ